MMWLKLQEGKLNYETNGLITSTSVVHTESAAGIEYNNLRVHVQKCTTIY